MICIQQSWSTTTLATSNEKEHVQKCESLSDLLISKTSSDRFAFSNEPETDDYNTSKSSSSSSDSTNDSVAKHMHKTTYDTRSRLDSLWTADDTSNSEHHETNWDIVLENDVFESSTRKSSVDSNSSRKSQHKLKSIIDWVQKNGRRASVKCHSLKRKASFPLSDTKKLHCFESEMKCFDKVLSDKENLRVFRKFLARELSDENLDFWLQVESYRKQKTSKRIKSAQKIYNTFIDTSSNFEINIDSCVRKHIQQNLLQADVTLFDVAQAQIYQLMERDSFRRFSNQAKRPSQA